LSSFDLACIVEGYGEVEAVPTLVRRIAQPALAATFDLDVARRAPSFEKLWREVAGLLRATGAAAKPDAVG